MKQMPDDTRVRMCIKEIREIDNEITGEVLKFSLLVLSAGVGGLGVIYFGSQVIGILNISSMADLLKFEVSELFTTIKLFISGEMSLIGYVLAREKFSVISADIEYKNYFQRELNELCEKDKVRVRKKARIRYEDKA